MEKILQYVDVNESIRYGATMAVLYADAVSNNRSVESQLGTIVVSSVVNKALRETVSFDKPFATLDIFLSVCAHVMMDELLCPPAECSPCPSCTTGPSLATLSPTLAPTQSPTTFSVPVPWWLILLEFALECVGVNTITSILWLTDKVIGGILYALLCFVPQTFVSALRYPYAYYKTDLRNDHVLVTLTKGFGILVTTTLYVSVAVLATQYVMEIAAGASAVAIITSILLAAMLIIKVLRFLSFRTQWTRLAPSLPRLPALRLFMFGA